MLTTYGDGKVNVNAAPLRVLMALPGIDADMAQLIWRDNKIADLRYSVRACFDKTGVKCNLLRWIISRSL